MNEPFAHLQTVVEQREYVEGAGIRLPFFNERAHLIVPTSSYWI